jgi:hypothetical protein
VFPRACLRHGILFFLSFQQARPSECWGEP